jgi:hypothetical protein
VVPFRRHLRVALGDDLGAHHRGHAGRPQGRRDQLVRPELPRKTLGAPGRPGAGPQGLAEDRQQRGRPDRQRGGPSEGPRHRRTRCREPRRGT